MSHRKRPAAGDAAVDSDDRKKKTSRPTFPSHLDSPDLPPKIRLLCEILSTTPASSLDAALDSAAIPVSVSDVESVLKLSYSLPASAVKFFRWAGRSLRHRHSPYSWNLVVDLLGKNLLFDAMWDAVQSMKSESLLSLATFASVFSSLAAASRPDEAIKAFHTLEPIYSIPCDSAALNSLLSALCREGHTSVAAQFLSRPNRPIPPPDADSYAILLEGWENEGDARGARDTFNEMVAKIGWDPGNVPAYDSFLSILIRGNGGISEALRFLSVLKERRCFPGLKFFRNALEEFVRVSDARGANSLWEALAGKNGCFPDTEMYNLMIALQCYASQMDVAFQFLDEMVVYGAFPDAKTYNVMLQFLLKSRKLREAAAIFDEMVKNECSPTAENCKSAVRFFVDAGDWEMGVKVWKFMAENELPVEDSGNMLVAKLRDLEKLPEACKFAEDMIDRGVKLNSATLSRLRTSLLKVGKGNVYDHILRKWKAH